MNTTATSRFLIIILSVFIVLTFISQVYLSREEYVTAAALPYSSTEQTVIDAVFVRNERIVTYDGTGAISYSVSDGGKLGVGSVVATIYDSARTIETAQEIVDLEHQLELLKKIQNPGTIESAQPSMLSGLIDTRYKLLTHCLETGDYDDLVTQQEELLVLLSTMQIITGEETDFNSRISDIESRIAVLKNSMPAPVDTLLTDSSGYFVSTADGFESELTLDDVSAITAERIDEIVSSAPSASSNAIGKLIDGFDWCIVAVVDNSKRYFAEGDKVTLDLQTENLSFDAYISELRPTDDLTRSVAVISCNNVSEQLVRFRTAKIRMTNNVYDGIKVPREALRFLNEQKGVYVKLGDKIVFRKLDIIYESKDYVISSVTHDAEMMANNDENDKSYVCLYDEIVLKGVAGNAS